jgi:hypothetical protein
MAKLGIELKKELIKRGYDIVSVKKGKASTGFAFNSGTKYRTITILGNENNKKDGSSVWCIKDELVHKLIVELGFFRERDAKSIKIILDEKASA